MAHDLPSELAHEVVPQWYQPSYGTLRVLGNRGLNDSYTDREIIIGGYASPMVIDRENHLILKEAMKKDLPRFLAKPEYANAMILHTNVQVGQVIPEWTDPETGKVYRTEVDEIGLHVVIRLRTDPYRPKIVDKVIDKILDGSLRAFSISGDAPPESRQYICADGTCFWIIPEIEFYEITICEEGVNQDAKMVILSKSSPAQEECEACEELKDKIETIAGHIGEEPVVQMLEDTVDARMRLAAAGKSEEELVSAIEKSDPNTILLPFTKSLATPGGKQVAELAQKYARYLRRGASPEDAYHTLLEEGPDWFGTRSEMFRRWLVVVYREGLPIPAVYLRMGGGKGYIDRTMTAWDLLQTSLSPIEAVRRGPAAQPHARKR
jgi:hypothetical protein